MFQFRQVRIFLSLAILVLAVSSSASASVVWTLTNVAFTDGGTATGSFTLDNSGSPTAWNITLDGGNTAVFPTITFLTGEPTVTDPTHHDFANGGFSRYIILETVDPLTNAGGSVPLDLATTIDCTSAPCRVAVSGSLESQAVPEPGSCALLGLGLSAAFVLRRRLVR